MHQSVFDSQVYDEPYNKTFSVRNVLLVTSLISGLTGWVLWKLDVEPGIIFAITGFIGMMIYDRIDFGDRPTL